ncbi:MAG: Omp28-related outer membrane protein [Ignavibacteria bacterium]|nr:Omp28-related outer membrane protein [Ignavibacteria bacterium]
MNATITSSLLIFFCMSAGGCDIIEDPGFKSPPPPIDSGVRKVLLIKYTGDRCGLCPAGNDEADKVQKFYGSRLVIVSMHTGRTFAAPGDTPEFAYDFRTPTGEELYNFLEKPGQPTGTVNFLKDGSKREITPTGWSTAIALQLALKPPLSIKITPQLSSDSILSLQADVRYFQTGSNHRLAVYLVEDSIVYAQIDYRKNPNPVIPNYLHRHVFRGAIGGGGAFGYVLPTAQSGETVLKNYMFDFRGTGFNLRHCSVIVAVSDGDTKNTLQVEEVRVLK